MFSISELGRFSGLKPHTIRAWEARYKALTPARSQGNTRYYDSGQMKRLLNLATLVNAGYLPSEVGRLTDERLHQLLESVAESRHSATVDYFISQLIAAGLTYDQARFEQVFSHCLARYRLKNTYAYILLPMLERIGLLWRCEKASPAQEHFVSNLLRQKLFGAVDRVAVAEPGAERWLLFLPENEFHEMGLLLAYCLVRISGHQAVYLGCNVPFSSLPAAIKQIQPDRLLLFTVNAELPRPLVGFLKDMDLGFPGKKSMLRVGR
ncbi:MerR family transcriptional regulator [Puia sp. P3]|uniref:MerR family transcriptional regulator n=1 Tax=Puia sp. P3 TaxID=3423952 RepID=UPI003D666F5E